MTNLLTRIAAASILLSTTGAVTAATETTTFQVEATVISGCNVSATNLAFGNYDPLSLLDQDGTSTITVQCSLGTTYDIGLDPGSGAGATVAARKMTKGADTLTYSLYQDLARLLVWGNTVDSDTLPGIGTGLAIPQVVYGRIPAGQNVNTGSYSDTVTVTVTF